MKLMDLTPIALIGIFGIICLAFGFALPLGVVFILSGSALQTFASVLAAVALIVLGVGAIDRACTEFQKLKPK